MGSGYNYLHADTLFELRKVLAKLDIKNLDCYLLCLRVLSRIINEFKANEYAQNAISLYIDCLVAIAPKLFKLSVSEREMYYSEVKNLIQIIKSKQQEYVKLKKDETNTDMEVDSGSAIKSDQGGRRGIFDEILYQNVGGKFLPINPQGNYSHPHRSKSALPFQLLDSQFQKYPNISVLKHLISI
jgi:hypothetical protein